MSKSLTLVVRNVDPKIYRAFKAKMTQRELAIGPALTRAMALYLSRTAAPRRRFVDYPPLRMPVKRSIDEDLYG